MTCRLHPPATSSASRLATAISVKSKNASLADLSGRLENPSPVPTPHRRCGYANEVGQHRQRIEPPRVGIGIDQSHPLPKFGFADDLHSPRVNRCASCLVEHVVLLHPRHWVRAVISHDHERRAAVDLLGHGSAMVPDELTCVAAYDAAKTTDEHDLFAGERSDRLFSRALAGVFVSNGAVVIGGSLPRHGAMQQAADQSRGLRGTERQPLSSFAEEAECEARRNGEATTLGAVAWGPASRVSPPSFAPFAGVR